MHTSSVHIVITKKFGCQGRLESLPHGGGGPRVLWPWKPVGLSSLRNDDDWMVGLHDEIPSWMDEKQ